MGDTRALRVLLVDDDETFRRVFGAALADDGFVVQTAADGLQALQIMNRRAFDLALVDLRMPRMEGLSLLDELQRRHPGTVPIVLTGFATVPSAVEAMRRNAVDVLSKSSPTDDILAALRRAAEARLRSRAGSALEQAVLDHDAFFGMVGKSAVMRRVFEAVDRFQDADQPALICGESGTGKELVARALHAGGPRKQGPLVVINCASLRENFVENELFGHARGAFTGAIAAKPGLCSLADGGSLHIDEVAEMAEGAQAALLRVLETGTFRPLGGLQEVRVSARILASTNRDIDQIVSNGSFRADLFYRLCVCRIDLPPLRDRREDIPLLVNHFLDRSANARRLGTRIGQPALDALMEHDWPGNVRELLNTLERAALSAATAVVEPRHLALQAPGRSSFAPTAPAVASRSAQTLQELERDYVRELLQRTGGNVTEVARILEVDPTTVRRKLRRWGEGA